jgi:hypothetical protein
MRLFLLFLCCLTWRPAQAAEQIDVALVLVSDVSRSVDDAEYRLQKQGYRQAFSNPRVIAAIQGGPTGAIAVAYVEFAGASEVRTVIGWTVLRDASSIQSFAALLEQAPRSFWGRTSISSAIDYARTMLDSVPFETQRKIIDVAGDGTNNAGRDVGLARDDAIEAGITINGLSIINEHPVSWTFAHVQPPGGLTEWYRQNVIGGPGAFVEEVHDFNVFGDAMTRKLLSEIALLVHPVPKAG